AAGVGFACLWQYQNAPGQTNPSSQIWPAKTQLVRAQYRATLIMFAHPRCPCTRASLEELNRLLARCEGKVAAQVLFFRPSRLPVEWTRGALWRSAAAMAGVSVHEDPDGAQ